MSDSDPPTHPMPKADKEDAKDTPRTQTATPGKASGKKSDKGAKKPPKPASSIPAISYPKSTASMIAYYSDSSSGSTEAASKPQTATPGSRKEK